MASHDDHRAGPVVDRHRRDGGRRVLVILPQVIGTDPAGDQPDRHEDVTPERVARRLVLE